MSPGGWPYLTEGGFSLLGVTGRPQQPVDHAARRCPRGAPREGPRERLPASARPLPRRPRPPSVRRGCEGQARMRADAFDQRGSARPAPRPGRRALRPGPGRRAARSGRGRPRSAARWPWPGAVCSARPGRGRRHGPRQACRRAPSMAPIVRLVRTRAPGRTMADGSSAGRTAWAQGRGDGRLKADGDAPRHARSKRRTLSGRIVAGTRRCGPGSGTDHPLPYDHPTRALGHHTGRSQMNSSDERTAGCPDAQG